MYILKRSSALPTPSGTPMHATLFCIIVHTLHLCIYVLQGNRIGIDFCSTCVTLLYVFYLRQLTVCPALHEKVGWPDSRGTEWRCDMHCTAQK